MNKITLFQSSFTDRLVAEERAQLFSPRASSGRKVERVLVEVDLVFHHREIFARVRSLLRAVRV